MVLRFTRYSYIAIQPSNSSMTRPPTPTLPLWCLLLLLLLPQSALSWPAAAPAAPPLCEWAELDGQSDDLDQLVREMAQLLSDGHPVTIRNATAAWTAREWEEVRDYPVHPGRRPALSRVLSLGEFAQAHLGRNVSSSRLSEACPSNNQRPYIFETLQGALSDGGLCARGERSALCAVLEKARMPFFKASSLLSDSQHGSQIGWSLGGKCQGLLHHRHGPAMALLLLGEKRWLVGPHSLDRVDADLVTEVYHYDSDRTATGGNDSGGAKARWLAKYYPTADFADEKWQWAGPAGLEPLQCVQRAGDLVALPNFAYHGVWNSVDSFAVTFLPCFSFIAAHALSSCGPGTKLHGEL